MLKPTKVMQFFPLTGCVAQIKEKAVSKWQKVKSFPKNLAKISKKKRQTFKMGD